MTSHNVYYSISNYNPDPYDYSRALYRVQRSRVHELLRITLIPERN